jgi:hypothetical protein
MAHWCSRVTALLITAKTAANRIPRFYPNLTFLSLQLKDHQNFRDLHLTIPKLTGLVIHIGHEEAFQVFKTWNLPKLQHLYITFGGVYPLDELFKKDRPSLLSLALRYNRISYPLPDIWSKVPNLLYLGSNSFESDMIVAPPNTHPLRTLGFLEIYP